MSWKFNPPPGWPPQPGGWQPPPGWAPDPSWPPAPPGWQFWVPADSPAAAGPTVPAGQIGTSPGAAPTMPGSFGSPPPPPFGGGYPAYAASGYPGGPPPTKPWYQQGLVVGVAVAAAVLLLTGVVGVGTFVLLRSDDGPQAQSPGGDEPTTAPAPTPEDDPEDDDDETDDDGPPANQGDGSGRYEGTGNDTLALDLAEDQHHTVAIKHTGDGWFTAWSTREGQDVTSLGWAYGPYEGTHVIGLYMDEKVDGIRIEANGDWTVTVGDLTDAPEWPDEDSGSGPTVLQVDPDSGEQVLNAEHQGESNFIVWAYNVDRHPTLLYNEIGEFAGSAVLPAGTFVITVEADGDWSLEER